MLVPCYPIPWDIGQLAYRQILWYTIRVYTCYVYHMAFITHTRSWVPCASYTTHRAPLHACVCWYWCMYIHVHAHVHTYRGEVFPPDGLVGVPDVLPLLTLPIPLRRTSWSCASGEEDSINCFAAHNTMFVYICPTHDQNIASDPKCVQIRGILEQLYPSSRIHLTTHAYPLFSHFGSYRTLYM